MCVDLHMVHAGILSLGSPDLNILDLGSLALGPGFGRSCRDCSEQCAVGGGVLKGRLEGQS